MEATTYLECNGKTKVTLLELMIFSKIFDNILKWKMDHNTYYLRRFVGFNIYKLSSIILVKPSVPFITYKMP